MNIRSQNPNKQEYFLIPSNNTLVLLSIVSLDLTLGSSKPALLLRAKLEGDIRATAFNINVNAMQRSVILKNAIGRKVYYWQNLGCNL